MEMKREALFEGRRRRKWKRVGKRQRLTLWLSLGDTLIAEASSRDGKKNERERERGIFGKV